MVRVKIISSITPPPQHRGTTVIIPNVRVGGGGGGTKGGIKGPPPVPPPRKQRPSTVPLLLRMTQVAPLKQEDDKNKSDNEAVPRGKLIAEELVKEVLEELEPKPGTSKAVILPDGGGGDSTGSFSPVGPAGGSRGSCSSGGGRDSAGSGSPRTLVRPCELHEVPTPGGLPLAIFSFITGGGFGPLGGGGCAASPGASTLASARDTQQRLLHAVANSPLLRAPGGLLLDSREKGVLYPMVHFTDDGEAVRMRLHQPTSLLDEAALGPEWTIRQGVYREVRNILPERSPGYEAVEGESSSFILIGFKSLDRAFSQVMVDTWKDWTGARSIYFHLPDELGLSRISFYHRETPEDLQLFMYVVLVECRCIGTPAKVCRLLDFTQRLRVERMNGYISVYTPLQPAALDASVGSRLISPTVLRHSDAVKKLLYHLNYFEATPPSPMSRSSSSPRSPPKPEI